MALPPALSKLNVEDMKTLKCATEVDDSATLPDLRFGAILAERGQATNHCSWQTSLMDKNGYHHKILFCIAQNRIVIQFNFSSLWLGHCQELRRLRGSGFGRLSGVPRHYRGWSGKGEQNENPVQEFPLLMQLSSAAKHGDSIFCLSEQHAMAGLEVQKDSVDRNSSLCQHSYVMTNQSVRAQE